MNIEQLFNEIGIEKEVIQENFVGKANLYLKCLNLFIKNDFIFPIESALIVHNYEVLESTSHSLKGTCANLGFKELYELSNKLVLDVRNEKYDELPQIFRYLKIEYYRVKEIIDKVLV